MSRLGIDFNVSPVPADDSMRQGETQSRALAFQLGGEEWHEKMRQGFLGDARTGVADHDSQVAGSIQPYSGL